jgi:TrpR-related protein YerC/YecD
MPVNDLRTEDVENLLDVLVSINDKDTLYALLEDMFTIREIRESSQRLAVARMLDEGTPYSAIEKQTGASATTIARVSKALNYGSGGYREMLDKMKQSGEIGTCVRQYGTDTGRKTE